MSISVAFVIFVAAVTLLAGAGIIRFFPVRSTLPAIAALSAWVVWATIFGMTGMLSNDALNPPGFVYVGIATVVLVGLMLLPRVGGLVATSVPVTLLMGFESFRIGTELFLERLWHAGMLPIMMTYHGANFDILIGASAPAAALLYKAGRLDARTAIAWNVVGILTLTNAVVRTVLSSPPLHVLGTEIPNVGLGVFPYSFVPTLMVPLALMLHVVSIRSLATAIKNKPAFPSPSRTTHRRGNV